MPKITLATLFKLVLASFLVGLALAVFDVTPHELLGWLRRLAAAVAADLWGWLAWAVSHVLIGALVVVPLWLLSLAWRAIRRKR
jgi:hypothetical protein